MARKGEMTVREMGRLGGNARAKAIPPALLQEIARKGGEARARNHTPEELRAFAKDAGRRPWKITPKVRAQILAMIADGSPHKEIADRFDISLRAIGRIVAQARAKGNPAA